MPILGGIGAICLLILPSDFSTAAMLGAICVTMLFVGGLPWKHMFRIVGLAVVGLIGLYGIGKAAPEALPRFGTWANRMKVLSVLPRDKKASRVREDYCVNWLRFAIYKAACSPWARLGHLTKLPAPPLFRHDFCIHRGGVRGPSSAGWDWCCSTWHCCSRASRTAIKCGRRLAEPRARPRTDDHRQSVGQHGRFGQAVYGSTAALVSYGGTSLLFLASRWA